MEIDKSKLGPILKEIRLSRGMLQKELAQKSGLTVNYLSLLENGKRGIGFDHLNKIAEILGVPTLFFTILATDFSSKSDRVKGPLLRKIQNLARQAIAIDSY